MADFKAFYKEAKYIFKERIFNDYAKCYANGLVAGFYFYITTMVIISQNADEIKQISQLENTYKDHIPVRVAGNSLRVQSSCDGVPVLIKFAFKRNKLNKHASQ
ncbi:FAD-binding oxidoreductase, partial [Campylobacter coli]